MSGIPGTRPVSLGDTADKAAKSERDIARLQGRVTCISDVQRRFLASVERLLTDNGKESVLQPLIDELRAGLDQKADNPAARAGYEFELERMERLTHRQSPDPLEGSAAIPSRAND